jgi:hypothetical protein
MKVVKGIRRELCYKRKTFGKEMYGKEKKTVTELTNSMAYGTRRFNTAFTRALQ